MYKFLRSATILLIVLVSSCSDKLPHKKEDKLYYLMASDRRDYIDTISYKDFQQYDSLDRFIAEDHFILNKTNHIIKAFTSDNHAPIDGGRFYYTLDSIGIIYTRSTTWPVSIRLSSNNDSINDLMNAALGRIILKPLLHCYQCEENKAVEEQHWTTTVIK